MRAVAIMALLLCPGCVGLGSRESSVTYPDGKIYRIRCQSDGMIDFVQGDVKVKVDNRGPLGQVWSAATAAAGKVYDVATKQNEPVK